MGTGGGRWSVLLVATVSTLVSLARVAHAEDAESHHRIFTALGLSQIAAQKPDYGPEWRATLGVRLAYYYRPFSHLDLGASMGFWVVDGIGAVYTPCLSLRPYVSLSTDDNAPELGFSLHLGRSIGNYYDATWLGTALSFGPDFRAFGPRTQFHASLELEGIGGQYQGPTNYDLVNQWTPQAGIGVWIGVVFAL